MKRAVKASVFVSLVAGALVLAFLLLPQPRTSAVTGSDWKAGRIIDDGVFFNGGALSESQIQTFLNSKGPTCDTNGTKSHSYYYRSSTGEVSSSSFSGASWVTTSRAKYGQRYDNWHNINDARAPYTCLKSYKTTVPSKPADSYCSGSISSTGSTKKSAAYIINAVSRACDVSPQALIVILQKEQSLITDDWPWKRQYTKAMGYACPDTAPCDPEFAGLVNQLYYAARQFQRYAKLPPGSYEHDKGPNQTVRYNPSSSCGSTQVNIQTQATAGLYNYTPYQPNSAALNNLYGTGNSCSSYGNRNFWRMHHDWFGSTYGTYKAQGIYKCCKFSSTPGETRTITLTFKNTGTADWYDEIGSEDPSAPFGVLPVMLMTGNPVQRDSAFAAAGWTGKNKPARNFSNVYESNGTTLAADQHKASPGQIVKYVFDINIPADVKPGKYKEYFQPVVFTKSSWIKSPGVYIYINVHKPVYKGQILGKDSSVETDPGQTVQSYVRIKNTGNMPWYDSDSIGSAGPGILPTMLVTYDPLMHHHSYGSLWGSARNVPTRNFAQVYNSNNTLASNQNIVMPGQWARFNVDFYVPTTSGSKTKKDNFILVGREKVGGKWKIIPYSGTETALSVVVN